MESLNEIRRLLDRFYRGETTLSEEEKLTAYFSSRRVPEEFIPDKELFQALGSGEEHIHVPDDLNGKIISRLDMAERSRIRTRRISIYSLSGLAAGLLVLIAVYLSYVRNDPPSRVASNQMMDTYEDPMDAYQTAKQALVYMSGKLNQGTDELKHVQRAVESTDPLQSLSKINRGTKELILLGQLHHMTRMDAKR